MQPPVSFSCNSTSSWICIGVFRPKRLLGTCSSEELATRLASISYSFNRFAKTAVLKARNSNNVVIFSVWEKGNLDLGEVCKQPKTRPLRRLLDSVHGSLSRHSTANAYTGTPPLLLVDAYEKALSAVCRVVHVSWYEASCWECKEMEAPPSSFMPLMSSSLSSPPPVHSDVKRFSHSMSCQNFMEDISLPPSTHKDDDRFSTSSMHSSSVALSSSSSQYHSSASAPTIRLSLGDIVHLRCITGSRRQAHLEDVLSYSCLAILKAYFPQTEGLESYTFYRSLDGLRMAGLGVWQGVDAASAFLDVPDGACEERYWRSMGAKARFEIYEVAALVV